MSRSASPGAETDSQAPGDVDDRDAAAWSALKSGTMAAPPEEIIVGPAVADPDVVVRLVATSAWVNAYSVRSRLLACSDVARARLIATSTLQPHPSQQAIETKTHWSFRPPTHAATVYMLRGRVWCRRG